MTETADHREPVTWPEQFYGGEHFRRDGTLCPYLARGWCSKCGSPAPPVPASARFAAGPGEVCPACFHIHPPATCALREPAPPPPDYASIAAEAVDLLCSVGCFGLDAGKQRELWQRGLDLSHRLSPEAGRYVVWAEGEGDVRPPRREGGAGDHGVRQGNHGGA